MCYLLMALGVLSVIGLGVWVSCLASLREGMSMSQSPMVGGAPYVIVLLIFVFAWLSYAFFGAALACKRTAEGGRALSLEGIRLLVCGCSFSSRNAVLHAEPRPGGGICGPHPPAFPLYAGC